MTTAMREREKKHKNDEQDDEILIAHSNAQMLS